MSHQVIDREVDGVFVDATQDGRIELRIGKPMKERFEVTRLAMEHAMPGGSRWVVPTLLERSASLCATLTPGEARIVAHELLAAAERASEGS